MYDDKLIRKTAERWTGSFAFFAGVDVDDTAQELRIAWWLAEQRGHPPRTAIRFQAQHMWRQQAAQRRIRQAAEVAATTLPTCAFPESTACIRKIKEAVSATQWQLLCCRAVGMSLKSVGEEFGWGTPHAGLRTRQATDAAIAAIDGEYP